MTPTEEIEKAVADVQQVQQIQQVQQVQQVQPERRQIQVQEAQQVQPQARQIQQAQQTQQVQQTSDTTFARAIKAAEQAPKTKKSRPSKYKVHFGFKRVILALACAGAAVFAIVYFVNLNTPDISLRVAAIQNGIDATYPGYVPRDYSLSDITSENGKITLNFKNATTGEAFTIMEEKSSWDSNALYTNFVKENYSDGHTVIREQGLTLYIDGSNACWVNGGIVYKLKTISGSLTKKQIKTIATSL